MIDASASYRQRLGPRFVPAPRYADIVLGDRPCLYMPLDERSGSSAADRSGWNHVGAYQNSPTLGVTGPIAGDQGTAITLNGTNQYVNVPNHNSLDPGDAFTLEAWVNPAASGTVHPLFDKNANGYSLLLNASNTLVLLKNGGATIVSSTANLSTAAWTHVVATKNGSTVKLYINGVDRTGAVSNSTIAVTASDLTIGRNSDAEYLNGSLAHVAIYPYALSATAVLRHYDYGSTAPYRNSHPVIENDPVYRVVLTPPEPPLFAASLHDDLVAYWKLDEASGDATDEVGSNTLTDINTVTTATSRSGSARQFTVANSERLMSADNADLSVPSTSFTFCGWIYADSFGADRTIISKNSGGSDLEYQMRYSNSASRITWGVYAGGSFQYVTAATLGAPSTGTWYFFVAWYDDDAETVNIRFNNGAVDSAAATGGIVDSIGQFALGGIGSGGDYWNGRIDEVGFWKRVLTSDEQASLFNNAQSITYSAPDTRKPYEVCSAWPMSREPIGYPILVPQVLDERSDVENTRFPLTTLEFDLLDLQRTRPMWLNGIRYTEKYGTGLATELISAGIIGYLVEFYESFSDIGWSDRILLFTGIVTEVRQVDGRYSVTARGRMTAAQDKIILGGATTRLTAGMNDTDTSMSVLDTADFEDAASTPESARKVVLIDSEAMVYRAKTATTFTSVQRSGASGYSVPPAAGASASHASGAFVYEMIKLGSLTSDNANYAIDDLHPIEHIKSILDNTGKFGIGEANVSYDEAALDALKATIGANVQMRWLHKEGVGAKGFLETEIFGAIPAYPLETPSGQLKLKMYQGADDAAFVGTFTDHDVLTRPRWLRNAQRQITTVNVHYDFMPADNAFAATFTYRDETLVSSLGRVITLAVFSKGLRSIFTSSGDEWFGETETFLSEMAARYVARFGGVCPIITLTTGLANGLLEIGDDVEVTFSEVADLGNGRRGLVNAPFEIVGKRTHYASRRIDWELLGYPQ